MHLAICLHPSQISFSSLEWVMLFFLLGRLFNEVKQITDLARKLSENNEKLTLRDYVRYITFQLSFLIFFLTSYSSSLPSFLPSFLPFLLDSLLPCFLPSFLPSFLPFFIHLFIYLFIELVVKLFILFVLVIYIFGCYIFIHF